MGRATTFDLFGTLVDVTTREDPADAIAAELSAREIPLPAEWQAAYRTPQVETDPGAELPLPEHVRVVLDTAENGAEPPDSEDSTLRLLPD